MKRTMKQLFALALALLLVGSLFACGGSDEKPADETEKKPDGKLETFLSDAKGDWYAYGNLNDQKITINEDGTFIADYDATTTNEGTISYDEDSERFMFEGQEQSSYGDLLEDGILRCWGARYYRAEQSIEFGQFNGNWYLDGDTNYDYYTFTDGKWMLMAAQPGGHATGGQGHVEYRDGDEYQLCLFEYVEDDEPIAAFRIEGEDELIMEADSASYVRLDAGDDDPDDDNDDDYDNDDDDTQDKKLWEIDDVEESELGIKYQYPYFVEGDVAEGRLYINDDGTFVVTTSGADPKSGTFTEDLDAETITFTFDDTGDTFEFSVEDDGAVLESDEGLMICVVAKYLPDEDGEYPDAYYEHPITPFSYYYLNGDPDGYSLFFFDFSAVTVKYSVDDEELIAYYSIDGDTMKISEMESFDGFVLTIEDDGKTLVSEDGQRFLLNE